MEVRIESKRRARWEGRRWGYRGEGVKGRRGGKGKGSTSTPDPQHGGAHDALFEQHAGDGVAARSGVKTGSGAMATEGMSGRCVVRGVAMAMGTAER